MKALHVSLFRLFLVATLVSPLAASAADPAGVRVRGCGKARMYLSTSRDLLDDQDERIFLNIDENHDGRGDGAKNVQGQWRSKSYEIKGPIRDRVPAKYLNKLVAEKARMMDKMAKQSVADAKAGKPVARRTKVDWTAAPTVCFDAIVSADVSQGPVRTEQLIVLKALRVARAK